MSKIIHWRNLTVLLGLVAVGSVIGFTMRADSFSMVFSFVAGAVMGFLGYPVIKRG